RAFAAALVGVTTDDPNLTFQWVTAGGDMGMGPLRIAGVPPDRIDVIHVPGQPSTSEDTRSTVEESIASGVELILFCGGDGTARDVAAAAKDRVPIVGIPAGVKMHSGLFAISPQAAANLLVAFLRGDLRVGTAEILDLDEEAYRKGEWRVRLFAIAKTLLGIDAVVGGKTIAKDVNEAAILRLLDRHPKALLVVSPVGGQGFILGRGNLQVSPPVLRRIGTRNVIVVATPSKLVTTPVLRVDTGDPSLDEEFRAREYLFVLVGYRTSKLHPIQRRRG